MSARGEKDWDEVFSTLADEDEVRFLDFEDQQSVDGFDLDDAPIHISTAFPLCHGKPQSGLVGQTLSDSFILRNNTGEPVELWSVRIFASNPKESFLLSLMKPPLDDSDEEAIRDFVGLTSIEDRVLQPGQTLTIWLSCKPKEIGMHTSVVDFSVGDDMFERVAFLLAEDAVSRSLVSNKPYTRRSGRRNNFSVDQYVPGTRPQRATTQIFRNKLALYKIPEDIRCLIKSKQVPEIIFEGLTSGNYAKYFSTLIVMEEIHLEEEMRGYDMECVTMQRRGNHFLGLEVPGLAEKRPSLMSGDYIFVKSSNSADDEDPYQGYIYRVEAEVIYLKFAQEVHSQHQNNNLYNVSFRYNRLNMRRLYHAINEAEKLGHEILFPNNVHHRKVKNIPFVPLTPGLNREQALAVKKILGCRSVPPYVIHGPPGTGKTMTLVEAILQIYKTRKDARILVCASSNSAADHVLEKLIGWDGVVQESKIFRLNAPSRPYEDLKTDFIRFCFFDNMIFMCPQPKALSQYKIIVSTYMSVSLLHAVGIRRGHFTHIFMDEAGQASEPEILISLANLCSRNTVVVLAGDPMQLGPTVYSKIAQTYGLGKSYLERLFESELYGNEDENFVTKLVRNYRCHPAILDLPSKLFYNSELIASKKEGDATIYDMMDLPNRGFPVLFVGIQGCDEREGNNPSWFNRTEASKVVELITNIRAKTDLLDSDIGVITPYRQQVLKIQKALETLEMPDVKVGSVEQFQGQEREIIIISTVRSTIKHNEFDRVFNLGFLSNPRRFNVAITRAKTLLIIIGNPHIIAKDGNWDKLLRYCAENGSYQGCALPDPEVHDDTGKPASDTMEYNQHYDGIQSDFNGARWEETNHYSNEAERGNSSNQWSTNSGWNSSDVKWGDDDNQWSTDLGCNSSDMKLGNNNIQWSADSGCNSSDVKWGDDSNQWGTDSNWKPSDKKWGDDSVKWE